MDLRSGGEAHFLQIHELEELRNHAYESSSKYKERVKTFHDKRLRDHKDLRIRDLVLLYNSRLRLFPGKLKSRWMGPYTVKEIFTYRAVTIEDLNGVNFIVNGHHLKLYINGPVDPVEEILKLHVSHA
ncbi:uncharacterized protein LOC110913623 [Helianthus annuus]|uniref:uncharacterized protein LOC110913623 n=1 Tax=Helianthus annuus TaxID=4232 RepID=UPI000B8FD105|nr:uncharacterized protein LOC110913623 [Helianthus annuus]